MTDTLSTSVSETSDEELRRYSVCCYWDANHLTHGTYEDTVFAHSDEEAQRLIWKDMNAEAFGDDLNEELSETEYWVVHCYEDTDAEAMIRGIQSVLDQVSPEVRAVLERSIHAGEGYYNEFSTGYTPPEETKPDALDDAMKGPGAPESPGPKT